MVQVGGGAEITLRASDGKSVSVFFEAPVVGSCVPGTVEASAG